MIQTKLGTLGESVLNCKIFSLSHFKFNRTTSETNTLFFYLKKNLVLILFVICMSSFVSIVLIRKSSWLI